mmetsp:Transcript_11368/g.31909  ORF Transcript_11368/g.31909 Transcript_11368/m.31909 type:complete len:875 (+) Transcript_11368:64-2688(+)|eukprot:CAMPEP_0119124934 /NCGR_PEP_ID=MMETSP1310-20130426/4381_1 /TAXON_ID=464262 /ORGANISM="Genus nov. species nov., Strain RCC2339" /LENGTH=874 /DNA_ID=CAMNT_0007114947 /DNA_START=67 /DNA_END=2691 /DNA_ORIENTATION=+
MGVEKETHNSGICRAKGGRWAAVVVAFFLVFFCIAACDEDRNSQRGVLLDELPTVTEFTLLHTGDMRGNSLPVNRFGSACTPEDYTDDPESCYGGVARRKTYVNSVRSEVSSSLLLEAGAHLQGSLFYSLFRGDAVYEYLIDLAYDVSFSSSREFFDGPENYGRLLQQADGTFKANAINLNVSNEPLLSPYFVPYSIFTLAGREVGFIGVTRSNLQDTTDVGDNVVVLEQYRALRAGVQELNDRNINIIVVVLGDLTLGDIATLVLETPNIDVVILRESLFHGNGNVSDYPFDVDGAYPTFVESPTGRQVPIVSSGYFGAHVGRVDLGFDELGRLNYATGDSVLLNSSIPMDPPVQASVEARQVLVEDNFEVIVGSTLTRVNGDRDQCRTTDCLMGNVVTNAMRTWVGTLGSDIDVDITLFNGGGIRDSWEAGDISNGDIVSAFPFGNTINRIELTARGLYNVLENSVAYAAPGDPTEGTTGRFLQVDGVEFTWNPRRAPLRIEDGVVVQEGSRVVRAFVNGNLVNRNDDNTYFRIALNDFIRGGGDDFIYFTDPFYTRNAVDQGLTVVQTVLDYVEANSPLDLELQRRITADSSSLPFDPFAATRPSKGMTISMQILASIAIVVCFIYLIAVFFYRNEDVMMSATPLFLVFIIFGGIMILTSVYLLSPDPTPALCTATVWCIALGWSILFGSLLVKNWRVAKILGHSKKFFRKRISIVRMLVILAVHVSITLVLLILFTAIDTPTVRHNSCKYEDAAEIIIYVIIGWNAIMMLPAIWISWKTKHVGENFNESKHIGWSVYNSALISCILLPIILTADDDDTVYLILSIGIIFGTMMTLSLLFIPKIYGGYKKLKVDRLTNLSSGSFMGSTTEA